MNYVSDGINNFIEGLVSVRSAKPIAEKLRTEIETRDASYDDGKISGDATIEFENMTFAFGDRILYSDFSYTFRKGGCYAIIGESGCGKSTLTKLILKYYNDYSGSIRVCGRDIRAIPEQELYAIVGLVNQTPFLFNAPMYENIVLYGNEPANKSEAYVRLLQELNLTALAERVGDSSLGDFGDNISGGERQRICIARAIRRHPQILIFDEPTTGLHLADLDNLMRVFRRLTEREYSLLIIEHNLDVIKTADYLIDLGPEGGEKGGTIVATGTPEEVAAVKSSYTGKFLKGKL